MSRRLLLRLEAVYPRLMTAAPPVNDRLCNLIPRIYAYTPSTQTHTSAIVSEVSPACPLLQLHIVLVQTASCAWQITGHTQKYHDYPSSPPTTTRRKKKHCFLKYGTSDGKLDFKDLKGHQSHKESARRTSVFLSNKPRTSQLLRRRMGQNTKPGEDLLEIFVIVRHWRIGEGSCSFFKNHAM